MSVTSPVAPASHAAPPRRRAWSATIILSLLLAALALAILVSASVGAAGIPIGRLLAALGVMDGDQALIVRDQLVLWSIRMPRIAIACMTGALLAAAGAIMQGLFRNPLAEPGLIGVSAGAALAAAITIVAGEKLASAFGFRLPFEVLPVAAFLGALMATTLLARFATREGRTSVATLLLAGIAVGAIAQAAIGLLIFLADDRQLRDITFWTLGSLGGATWGKAAAIVPFFALLVITLPFLARGLDCLVLGEAEAFYMGIDVDRLKQWSIILVAAIVGAAVSVGGIIGFVGIVVPHLLRLVIGPSHRLLLPAAVCFGAILLLLSDTVARIVVAPAELPIGIVTAAIGAPFFLALLLRQRSILGL
jgi:iron complex transport system permease protein